MHFAKNHTSIWTKFFGNKEFVKLFLKLSIPAILQQLISLSVLYIDNFMLSSLLNFDGAIAKTAVGLTGPLISFSILYSMSWVAGIGILLSQYYGNQQFNKTREILFLRLWFGFLLVLPFFLLFLLIPGQLIQLTSSIDLGSKEYDYAKVYLFVYAFNLFPTLISYSFSNALIETKRQIPSLLSSIVGVVFNIILDPIVVVVFKNDPYMAVCMVGVTTIIARIFQLIYCLIYILIKNDASLNIFKKRVNIYGYNINCLISEDAWRKFDTKTIKHALKYSIPIFLNDAVYALGYLIMNICLLSFGKGNSDYYDATTNVTLFLSFVEIIWAGLASASSILIAAKLGEGKISEAKANSNKMIRWSLVIIVIIALFIFICSWFVNDILSPNEPEVVRLAQHMEWILLPTIISQGLFSALYFAIRSGGTKLIVWVDSFIVFLWAIVMCALTFTHSIDNCPPELFFFLIESNQIVKCILAFILYQKSNWARNLTYNHHLV